MTTVASRRQSALPQPKKRQGAPVTNMSPCAYDPGLWDLDNGSFVDAMHARTLCNGDGGNTAPCPMRDMCNAQIENGGHPNSLVQAGRFFTHRGTELKSDRAVLSYCNRIEGQRKAHPDAADPLELVEMEDYNWAAAKARRERRREAKETLRALSREVPSTSGVQFTLDLGA